MKPNVVLLTNVVVIDPGQCTYVDVLRVLLDKVYVEPQGVACVKALHRGLG